MHSTIPMGRNDESEGREMRDWLKNVFNNIEDCDHIRHEVRRAANHGLALSLSRDNVVRLDKMLSDWRDGMEYKIGKARNGND